MKVSERLEARRGSWQELERLCGRMEAQWRKKAPAQAVARFASLYRSACADLALADAYNLPPGTITYLHQLVARAHNQLYRTRTFQLNKWRHTLFVDVPRQLYSDICLRLAMLLFWGIFILGMALAWREPEYAYRVSGKASVNQVEESFAGDMSEFGADNEAFMGGFYTKHNATIGLRCFAYGMLFGVGGLLETAMNAAMLGTIFGYMLQSPSRDHFFTFVTAHSFFELTAIVLMAAAGMRLGFSMIDTQGRSRSDSLRYAATQIVPIMSVGVILFLFAAAIESFVSHSALPFAGRLAVAAFSALLLFLYIVALGYRGEKAARAEARADAA
jgi:uncharacterized membrane protein SpoIIM required for sporulation